MNFYKNEKMRIFLSILILIFNFQSWTKADDIKDFEINGISIGDNLLDYYSKEEIKNGNINKYPNDQKFLGIELLPKNSSQYEVLQFHYNDIKYKKSSKKKLIVDSIVGGMFFPNIDDCYLKKDEIVEDISKSLTNFKINYDGTYEAREDTSGRSTMTAIIFESDNGEIGITCTFWEKEFKNQRNYENNLRIDISTIEFSNWLRYEAYN